GIRSAPALGNRYALRQLQFPEFAHVRQGRHCLFRSRHSGLGTRLGRGLERRLERECNLLSRSAAARVAEFLHWMHWHNPDRSAARKFVPTASKWNLRFVRHARNAVEPVSRTTL